MLIFILGITYTAWRTGVFLVSVWFGFVVKFVFEKNCSRRASRLFLSNDYKVLPGL